MFIGFYNYTVYLTYIGLASAVIGMAEAFGGDYKKAVLCLLICGICDMFDGTIARTHKKRSEDAKSFGTQIDSLCDVICFGVFPAVIGLSLCPGKWFMQLAAVFYVLAAVIRLAYFNVQEINRMGTDEKREFYLGLPVTSSSLIMPAIALVTSLDKVNWMYLYPTALIVLGLFFILKVRVKKPYVVGLVCFTAVYAAIIFLTFKYGGKITCVTEKVIEVARDV